MYVNHQEVRPLIEQCVVFVVDIFKRLTDIKSSNNSFFLVSSETCINNQIYSDERTCYLLFSNYLEIIVLKQDLNKELTKKFNTIMKQINEELINRPNGRYEDMQWQKKYFGFVDRRDLERDITILVHDTTTNKYYRTRRTKYLNDHIYNRSTSNKVEFNELNHSLNHKAKYKSRLPEHVIKIETSNMKKIRKTNYRTAKKLLDQKKMLEKYLKDKEERNLEVEKKLFQLLFASYQPK